MARCMYYINGRPMDEVQSILFIIEEGENDENQHRTIRKTNTGHEPTHNTRHDDRKTHRCTGTTNIDGESI